MSFVTLDLIARLPSNAAGPGALKEMTESEQTVVLVADDEPSTLALVTAHVRAKGYKVIEASDGDMAWQLAHQHLPHLVILDVMMPGMSGWEVCRKIRESLPLAHSGVIMLTGIGENLNEMTSPLYGADAHIDKPFEFGDLDDVIQQVLTQRSGKFGRSDDADVEHEEESVDELAAIPSLLPPAELDDLDFSDDERELPLDSLPPPPPAPKGLVKPPVKAAKKSAKVAEVKAAAKPAKAEAPLAKKPVAAAKKPAAAAKQPAAAVKQAAKKVAEAKPATKPVVLAKQTAVKQTTTKKASKATGKAVAAKASAAVKATVIAKPVAKKATAGKKAPTKQAAAKKAPAKKPAAKATLKPAVKKTAKKVAKSAAKSVAKPPKSSVRNVKPSKATQAKPIAKKASKKKTTKR